MRFCKLVIVLLVYVTMLCISDTCCVSLFQNDKNSSNESRFFTEDLLESRKKKKGGGKYLLPLLFGALLIKSIIFPLALKTMAVMTSIAVLLSTMSLIISSIVGYVKLAMKPNHPTVKVIHVNDNYPLTWAKDDDSVKNYGLESVDYDPNVPLEQSYHPYK